MTPSQAYAQWKQYAADPSDSEAQSIQKFSQQFGLDPVDKDGLLEAYPERPKYQAPRESGFAAQTFGAGIDELQKSAGSAIAGPGAEVLADFGWEGGAGFLEDIGTNIVRQQEEDLQAYEAPQTRDQLIEEGGVWGSLYENVLPEETQTPQQLGRQALPSLGAAGIALGAAGVAALASGGNPFIVGATAMAVGNAVGSFQVGGEEFEAAKRDPFIRKQLGINPDAKFEDLTPTQQRDLTDSAQRVAKDTMVERVYQGGALESLAFIPYGPLALRYIADIALGATSEEMDKRLGMQNTLEELERLGVAREEIPELREKMKALRPGTFETVWNAAIMEATFGSPTAIIETIAQPDSRVDRRLTADAEKKRMLQQRLKEAQADPAKLKRAENDLIKQDDDRKIRREKEAERLFDRQKKQDDEVLVALETRQQKADEMAGQDRMGRTIESSETNGFTDFIYKAGMTPEAVDSMAREYAEQESARAEEWAKQETDRQFEPTGKKKKKKSTSSRSRSSREEVVIQGEGVLDSMDAMDNVPAGTAIDSEASDPGGDLISFDKLMQQVALNEYTAAFPEINFKGSTLVKNKNGETQIIYEDENGDIQSDSDWALMEGFVDDEQIFGQEESPVVYLTQSMYDDNGNLIKDTKAALERMTEVAFHEAIGHAGLRNVLSAGKMLDVDANRDENGKIQNKDYQRWEGEQYNNFIDGFRNRHSKMINRWVKGDGNTYANESEFRQTEEFIARNYGESGGGKPIGFFDNAAILLRELNPFIGNSLTQHQVAKQLQLVVDKYATGIEGKAPDKKNILSGAELVGAISRAATEAGIEKDVETETEIGLVSTRRQKAKSEKETLKALKKPDTNYEVMAPEQIQELNEVRTVLKGAREKQTAGIKEEKQILKELVPAIRKKIKKDTTAEAKAQVQAQKDQTSEDLRIIGKSKTSAEVLDGLAKTGTPQVRIDVAKHKNTSDKTLAMLEAVKGQPGVVKAAIDSINKREAAATKVVENKTREEKRAVEKKALNETSLAEARDVVKELNAKLKDKGKLNKADFTRLVKKGGRVKELEKILGITKKGKKSTSKRSKSKRSLSGKKGVAYTSIVTDDEEVGGDRQTVRGSDTSLTVYHFAGRSNLDEQVPEPLNVKEYKEGVIKTQQKAPLFEAANDLPRLKGEPDAKYKARVLKKIAKIRKDKIAELTAAKTELNKLLSTKPKISDPKKHWAKIKPAVEALRVKIRELTEGKDLTKKEVKESTFMKSLRARPWEFFGIGLFLSQDDRNLSLIKPLTGQGKTDYSLSAEDVVDIDILEAGITIESLRVDLNNSLLALKGIDEWKPRGKAVLREGIKSSEKKITRLEEKRVDYQKEIEGDISYAFDNILNEKEKAALIYDMGMSKEYGMMDQSQIATLMKEEGITTSEGSAPRQQWVSKQINGAIEKMRESIGYGINKTKPPEKGKNYYENYQLVKPWLKSVLAKYPKTTGEKTKTGKARTEEVAKDDAETKRRWDELLTGRLALDSSGNIPKGLRPERTEAATALYRDTGLITKPESKENWKAWGSISDEDMAYLKEAAGNPRSKDYEWQMIRPPAGTDVVSEDILGGVAPSEEFQTFQETKTKLEKAQINSLVELAKKGKLTSTDIQKVKLSSGGVEALTDIIYGEKFSKKYSSSKRSKSKREINAYKKVLVDVQESVLKAFGMASPQMQELRDFFTKEELELMGPQTVTAMQNLLEAEPTAGTTAGDPRVLRGGTRLKGKTLATMASLGVIKKGWYENSANALRTVFKEDTEQFVALLAALSPQISVEGNLENTLNIWDEWIKAGRPTSKKGIIEAMGKGVQKTPIEKRLTEQLEKISKALGLRKGNKNLMIKRIKAFESLSPENAELVRNKSVMEAWLNNSIRSLSGKKGAEIKLSGPKVESFRQNLLGEFSEVTQDTWEATALGVIQAIMGGQTRNLPVGGVNVALGYKSPAYLVSAALHRQAADLLTKSPTNTETWTPAEVQETVWSFVKAVVEQRESKGETRTISKIVEDTPQLEKNIASVPDFATLLSTGKYSKILKGAGYATQIKELAGLSKVGLKGKIADQGAYKAGDVRSISEQLEEYISNKSAKKPWDTSSVPVARLREIFGVNDEAATLIVTEDISERFGTTGNKVDLKSIQIYDLESLIGTDTLQKYLDKKGFNVKLFSFEENKDKGIEFVLPNLIGDGYHKKTLWIYNPENQAASFRDADYTKAWRVSHEMGHAVTEKFVQKKYGPSARDGRLGASMSNLRGKPPKQVNVEMRALTLKEAQRAIEWEDTAFRAQRRVLEDLGVKISDEQFIKEYNINIKGAVHRIITGRFDEVIDEGFLPYVNKQANLKSILKMLENTEIAIAKAQGRKATKGVDLKKWKTVTDEDLNKAVKKGSVSSKLPQARKIKKTDKLPHSFSWSKRSKAIAEPASRQLNPAVVKVITDPNFRTKDVSKSKRSQSQVSRSQFAAGADQRFGSRWTNFWLRQLAKIRPLSQLKEGTKEFYLQLRQVAFGQLAQWEYFSNSVFNALKDSKQSKEIYKYLTTPNANSSIISDNNERVHAEKAKKAIERIGETLVSKRLMKETTLRDFKKKHGDYLPRIYLRHLLNESDRTAIARGLKPSNLDYLKQRRDIPKGVRELILGELTDQQGAPALLASRALMVPGKDLAIMSWMQKMKDLSVEKGLDWVIPDQFVTFNTLEEARTIAEDLNLNSAVIKELELDVDFSDMSSEVTPAWLITESNKLRLMAVDLQGERKQIVTELYRRMEDTAKKQEPMFGEGAKIEGYRKLPNSARYGAMRGMWIHKQIADDIIGGMKLATGDESNWEKIVGETGMMGRYNAYWKWAKVAGNPPSWARNFVSNNILLTLAGIPFWSIPRLNLAAMKEMRTKGKYYQVALRQGVMAGNMSNAELGRMETDFLQIERNMSDSGNPLAFLGGIQSATGKLMDATSNIYGGLETLGKIGAIKYAMEKKGMNESDAAAFANKWLFDYGLVTPSVRYASTAVVGAPFIRFQSHAIPLMLEVGLTKPWRFLPYYALGYGMIEMFKNSHDIDEEEYESILLALAPWLQEKALNPKIPGTSIPLLPPNILPMPYLDKQGRWQIHDVSYLMPFGMISEVAGEVAKGRFSDALKSLGMMGGPLADMMVVLKTGVDPFTRRPITEDTKPYIGQVADYIKYIYNMSMPSMFHTSHGAVNRIWDSSMGNLDPKTGEMKYEPLQAWLRMGGQNIYPTNLVEQRRTNIRRMKWEIGNLKTAHTRLLRGLIKSKASREEIAEARSDYRELLKERQLEMVDYVKKSKVPQSLRSN